MLQEFINCLVDKNNSISGVSLYLVDKRVQEFLQIEDPLIIQKIVMMSFQGSAQPQTKVYTKLNIVDEYQNQKGFN